MKTWLIVITIAAALFVFWLLYVRDVSAGQSHWYSPSPVASMSPSTNPCDSVDVAELQHYRISHPCVSASPSASSSATPAPTTTPEPTPISVDHSGEGDGLGCANHDCSGNKIGSPVKDTYPNSPYDGQPVGWK